MADIQMNVETALKKDMENKIKKGLQKEMKRGTGLRITAAHILLLQITRLVM